MWGRRRRNLFVDTDRDDASDDEPSATWEVDTSAAWEIDSVTSLEGGTSAAGHTDAAAASTRFEVTTAWEDEGSIITELSAGDGARASAYVAVAV